MSNRISLIASYLLLCCGLSVLNNNASAQCAQNYHIGIHGGAAFSNGHPYLAKQQGYQYGFNYRQLLFTNYQLGVQVDQINYGKDFNSKTTSAQLTLTWLMIHLDKDRFGFTGTGGWAFNEYNDPQHHTIHETEGIASIQCEYIRHLNRNLGIGAAINYSLIGFSDYKQTGLTPLFLMAYRF